MYLFFVLFPLKLVFLCVYSFNSANISYWKIKFSKISFSELLDLLRLRKLYLFSVWSYCFVSTIELFEIIYSYFLLSSEFFSSIFRISQKVSFKERTLNFPTSTPFELFAQQNANYFQFTSSKNWIWKPTFRFCAHKYLKLNVISFSSRHSISNLISEKEHSIQAADDVIRTRSCSSPEFR